jgi:hypothetical protein
MREKRRPLRAAYDWDKWVRRIYRALARDRSLILRHLSTWPARRTYRDVMMREARQIAARGEVYCREWLERTRLETRPPT